MSLISRYQYIPLLLRQPIRSLRRTLIVRYRKTPKFYQNWTVIHYRDSGSTTQTFEAWCQSRSTSYRNRRIGSTWDSDSTQVLISTVTSAWSLTSKMVWAFWEHPVSVWFYSTALARWSSATDHSRSSECSPFYVYRLLGSRWWAWCSLWSYRASASQT